MLGVGRDLCGSSGLTPLDHLQQAAQEHVQVGLEYLQRGRLHSLPGHPVPVLRHPLQNIFFSISIAFFSTLDCLQFPTLFLEGLTEFFPSGPKLLCSA